MSQNSLNTNTHQDSHSAVNFDDLIAQVPAEWKQRFRVFVEKGEDPGGELLAYLDEQAALPEPARGTVLNMLDQASRRGLKPLLELGAALRRADEMVSSKKDRDLRPQGNYDDLIVQVPVEWRERFRAFAEKGEDPNGEFYAYLAEQAELAEASRENVLHVLDEAFKRSWNGNQDK